MDVFLFFFLGQFCVAPVPVFRFCVLKADGELSFPSSRSFFFFRESLPMDSPHLQTVNWRAPTPFFSFPFLFFDPYCGVPPRLPGKTHPAVVFLSRVADPRAHATGPFWLN